MGGINKVVVNGETKIDLTSDTVVAASLLSGYTAHDKSGSSIIGTMPNNGKIVKTMDGTTVTSVEIPAGYTSGGTVSLTTDFKSLTERLIDALNLIGISVGSDADLEGCISAVENFNIESGFEVVRTIDDSDGDPITDSDGNELYGQVIYDYI